MIVYFVSELCEKAFLIALFLCCDLQSGSNHLKLVGFWFVDVYETLFIFTDL